MIKIANNLKYMVAKKKTDKPEAEELVGDQDKLDLNNNKRLDAQDFKMIRSKKSDDADEVLKYLKEQQGILGKNYVRDDAIAGGLGGLALGGLGGAAYGSQTGDDRRYESAHAKMKSVPAGRAVLGGFDLIGKGEDLEKEMRTSLKDPETKIKNQKLIDDLEKSMADKAKATKAK